MPQADPQLHNLNRILAALAPEEYARLAPFLSHQETLPRGLVLEPRQEPTTFIYFPWSGVCSLTTVTLDGRVVEVGTIGNEGIVGMTAFFGGQLTDLETVVQVAGCGASVMRTGAFVAEMERRGPLYLLTQRYSQALLSFMTRSIACNALHDVHARCARWLLLTHDRVGGDTFGLTQDYLAAMLGVRRSTVTLIARDLQKRGLIRYRRGEVTILRRRGLERSACECYAIVRGYFDRLVP